MAGVTGAVATGEGYHEGALRARPPNGLRGYYARVYCPRSFNWNGDSKRNPSIRTPTIPPIFSVTVKEFPAMAARVGVASTTAPFTRYETAVGATCTSSVF